MAGLLDFLLSDPTGASPGGGLLSKIFGLNTPTTQAPAQQPPYGSAGYPFNYQKGLFGNSMLGNALRGGMAGLAGSTGYTGMAALGAGAQAGEQSAVRRQLLNQQNLLGNQQYQSGQQGLLSGNIDLALKKLTAEYYGIDPNTLGAAGQTDPNAMPQGGAAPSSSQGGMAPGPGGRPLLGEPNAAGETPSSNWRQMLNEQGNAMLHIPGMYAEGIKAIQTAQTAPEGYQFSNDFQSLMRIGGGPKDPQSIATDAAAAAGGALPYKLQEMYAGKAADVANAGQLAYFGAKGADIAAQESNKTLNQVVSDLSHDYQADPNVQDWAKANLAIGTARQALANPDQKAADILLAQAAIQMAVPNAQLRAGNIDQLTDIKSLKDVAFRIKQAVASGSAMSSDDRQALKDFIENKYRDINATHQQIQQSYIKRAGQSGQNIDPQTYMPDYKSQTPVGVKQFESLPTDARLLRPGERGYIADGKQRYYSATLGGVLTKE